MTVAVLRYDEGPDVGFGHRRRIEAIASSLIAIRLDVDLGPAGPTDPISGPIVVLDSYRRRADDAALVQGATVVALDDLHRDLSVDLLVEPGPGAKDASPRAAREVLAGAAYSIVDPALRQRPTSSITDAPRCVLVTLGGASGAGDLALHIAESIAIHAPGIEVRVAGSPSTPPSPRVAVLPHAAGIAAELASADIVVTAGGVTLLEALTLGRPVVAVETAPNQRDNLDGVAAAGAALLASPTNAAEVVCELLGDRARREALGGAGAGLIDGSGANRVADAIVRLHSDLGSRHVV